MRINLLLFIVSLVFAVPALADQVAQTPFQVLIATLQQQRDAARSEADNLKAQAAANETLVAAERGFWKSYVEGLGTAK